MSYYEKRSAKSYKKIVKFLGAFLVIGGLGFLLYFFFPVLSYQFFLGNAFEGNKIEVPIPKYLVASRAPESNFGSLIATGISNMTNDYTDARNWYPNLSPQNLTDQAIDETKNKIVSSYEITIPSLKINNAFVSTTDYDLSDHLVQYFGTALPGEKGTSVVFGHSTIPSWFDPTDYKTIFATLHTIKSGDEIFVKVGDKEYKYKVFSMVVTTPDDVNILSQSYDNSYLTLVTCTPPGTIWKRLVVRASLEEESV